MRKKIALLLALLMAAGLGLFGVSPASAHTGDLNATAVCQSDGTYLVTYKLTITNTNLTGVTKWRVGNSTFEGTPTSNAGLNLGPVNSTGAGTYTLGTTVVAGNKTSAPWAYAFTTWSDGYTKGSDGGDISLGGNCKPAKPDPKTGQDKGQDDPVCVDPANGTATIKSWTQDWTQAYVFDTQSWSWKLGEKVYSEKVFTTKTVDQDSCIPTKPPVLKGEENGSDDPVCVKPLDGTSTTTSWTQPWTQTASWDPESHTWVYGEKVYGDKVFTTSEPTANERCTPPPVVEKCETIESGPVSTPGNPNGWDFTDTRSAGHYVYTPNGLRVFTDDNSSQAKVAGYIPTSFALKHAGVPALDWTGTEPQPGKQMVMDWNGDNVADTILVGEPVYGDNWWGVTSGWTSYPNGAPSVGGGGSAKNGTLNDWLALYPDAKVIAVGFSLGSGILGDGVIHSLTFGCVSYTFDVDAQPKDKVVVVTVDKGEPTCGSDTVPTETTTTTTPYVLDEETGLWVEGKPTVEVTTGTRPLTEKEKADLYCPITVTPVDPVVVQSDTCDVQGSYTIPATQGITYLLDGEPIAAGTYDGPASGTITAEANEGFVIQRGEQAAWSFSLNVAAAEECATPTPTPTPTVPNEPPLAHTGADGAVFMGVSGIVLILLAGIAFAVAFSMRSKPSAE